MKNENGTDPSNAPPDNPFREVHEMQYVQYHGREALLVSLKSEPIRNIFPAVILASPFPRRRKLAPPLRSLRRNGHPSGPTES